MRALGKKQRVVWGYSLPYCPAERENGPAFHTEAGCWPVGLLHFYSSPRPRDACTHPFSAGNRRKEPWTHTPSIAFRHLPPISARFSYATEGALFISVQLSTDAVSALRKVWVLIWLWKQPSAKARTLAWDASTPGKKREKRKESFVSMMMMSWCLMSSDVSWHIRDKLWPMPKHGSIILYVHGNQKAR